MPGRKFVSGDRYRYGFNGKENDPETVGTGEGTQDYGLRIYNPALGKFLSVDPLTKSYPWYTPYQFAGNKPINSIDLDGAEEFQKISPAAVDAGLKERTAKGGANKIDQGMTPTCGIAAVCNVVAENDPKGYAKTVIDLYTKGSASYNNYNIKPDDHLFSMDPNSSAFPENSKVGHDKVNVVDWMLLSSIRDTDNGMFDYDGEQGDAQFYGSTSAGTVSRLMKDFAGYTNVKDKTSYVATQGDVNSLETMNNSYRTGGAVLMLVNAHMIKNQAGSATPDHWVVYKGGLQIDEKQKTVQFNVFSWGELKTLNISFEAFKSNFYGTITGVK